jgi:hypothetical protein
MKILDDYRGEDLLATHFDHLSNAIKPITEDDLKVPANKVSLAKFQFPVDFEMPKTMPYRMMVLGLPEASKVELALTTLCPSCEFITISDPRPGYGYSDEAEYFRKLALELKCAIFHIRPENRRRQYGRVKIPRACAYYSNLIINVIVWGKERTVWQMEKSRLPNLRPNRYYSFRTEEIILLAEQGRYSKIYNFGSDKG